MNITKKIKLSILALIALSSIATRAQMKIAKHAFTLNWGAIIPVGEGNFTDKTTFLAPQLSYEYRVSKLFSAGISVGFSSTQQSGITREKFDGDLITSYSNRDLTLIPIQVQFLYFPLGRISTSLQPYIAIGAGVQCAQFYITADAIPTSKTRNWAEVITPQIGLRYHPAGKRVYADFAAQWQHGGNSWKIIETTSQQNVGVRIGIGFYFL